MVHDDDEGDDQRPSGAPLPPDDRVWRHPSELGGVAVGMAMPAPSPSSAAPRRQVLALAGACLTGAVLTCGLLWLTRPGWVSEEPAPADRPRAAATATTTVPVSFTPAGVPTTELAGTLAPHLVAVEAERDGTWTSGTGIALADGRQLVVATPLVEGAGYVAVSIGGRRRVAASTVGEDAATGTTLLAVADGDVAPAPGTLLASTPRAGQAVAVIGARTTSATGDDQQRVVPASVSTAGARASIGDTVLHDAIELDRRLPDDALGAAVVDAGGHLLGVVVDVGDDRDLAVAVPGRTVLVAAADLLDDGEVRRAWLGVEAADVDPATASLLQIDGGALVTAVDGGSPAAQAGLQPTDIIVEVGDLEVRDASDLVVAIRAGRPGEQVELCWMRGALEQRAQVTLGG